jgi:hypothetical protein
MSVQKIIQEAINKNPHDLKEALQEELRSRIALALEAKMSDEKDDDEEDDEEDDDSSEEDDEEDMKEEAEQIDERWADNDHGWGDPLDFRSGSTTDPSKIPNWKAKTEKGKKAIAAKNVPDLKRDIKSALGKHVKPNLPEEAEQIDELKKSTLASYVSKAADNAASHAIKYGEKKAQSDEMDRMLNRHMSYDDKDKMRSIMKTTNKDVNEPRYKAAKRLAGVDLAVKKLTRD